MSDAVNNDTNDSGTDPTLDPNAQSSTDGGADGSQAGGDASLWQSRFNGLNAKFGTTQAELKAEKEAREKIAAELEALRSGKVSADEAAQAKVNEVLTALEAERTARKVESLKAKFPETFEVFGDAAATFEEGVLAASEARLAGEGADPTPLKHNESRSSAGSKKPAEKTAADVEAELLSMKVPWA